MSRWLTGWRLALRLARREALKARGRTALVLVMIALPVLGVVAAGVLYKTSSVDLVEGLDRRIGTEAAALVYPANGGGRVVQGTDPTVTGYAEGDPEAGERPSLDAVLDVLGDRPATPMREGYVAVATDAGQVDAQVTEVDPAASLADGLFRLTDGRLPSGPGEVAVNVDLAERGPGLGEQLVVPAGRGISEERTAQVVGIIESAAYRSSPVALATGGLVDPDRAAIDGWLVGGGPVEWEQVVALNGLGAFALSRAVVEQPPAAAEEAADDQTGADGTFVTGLVLVITMVLIEVVLLAGPAFAVGARRQSRALALIAASGGTPAQARRVVLASGVVLGSAAAVLGVATGVVLAWVLQPVAQRFTAQWLGPFEVPWLIVLGVAAFGVLSALLAAVVPAWIASRQDVVAVLAGRRGDRAPSLRSPLLGLALVGLGVAGAAIGATMGAGGEVPIAFSAVLSVLGMVLLVPVVVAVLARAGRRLPFGLRFALRDAARHRTRTAPAVAAVAATVAGVVALGIATSSDERQSEETYTTTLPMGQAAITADPGSSWSVIEESVHRYVPDADVLLVEGVSYGGISSSVSTDVSFAAEGNDYLGPPMAGGWINGSVLAARDGTLPELVAEVDGVDVATAEQVLGQGGAVVFTSGESGTTTIDLRISTWDYDTGESVAERTHEVAAYLVPVDGSVTVPVVGVVAGPTLEAAGVPLEPVGMLIRSEISEQAQERLEEALAVLDPGPSLYVERGYQPDDETVIIQLILAGLGAVLMLGGTLTATFLALSDARPDLATLAAIGAAPRARRAVAAAYALSIAVVGAVLGVVVGMVPGIAVAFPLTRTTGDVVTCSGSGTCTSLEGGVVGPFIDVPWLMILGLVVALPLLVSAIVALCTRSRLPMVARLG